MNSNSFLNQSDLTEAVTGVLSSMLGITVEMSSPEGGLGQDYAETVSASVGMSGDWDGVLLLRCHQATACFLAGEMLGTDAPPSVDGDVRDVLGEIANMTAGGLKEKLPGRSSLHLPCVIDGCRYEVTIKGGHTILSLLFSTDEHQMLFSVVQSDNVGGANQGIEGT